MRCKLAGVDRVGEDDAADECGLLTQVPSWRWAIPLHAFFAEVAGVERIGGHGQAVSSCMKDQRKAHIALSFFVASLAKAEENNKNNNTRLTSHGGREPT